MNLKIFQIHCMPLTSNHFIYPPFQEIQYNYYILDISNLFFNKDRLKKYKHNSKLKKYPNCLYINIKNRQKLKKILKKYINDKTLFLFDDIISVDLFWLLKFIEKFNSKIYLPYKVAQLDKTKSNLNKISDSLSSLKYLKHMIPKVPLLFKRLIYSKTNFYMKPDILFTPGNSYGYWERNINPKKIISINSPQILLKKEKKIRRLVYIDEDRGLRRVL